MNKQEILNELELALNDVDLEPRDFVITYDAAMVMLGIKSTRVPVKINYT